MRAASSFRACCSGGLLTVACQQDCFVPDKAANEPLAPPRFAGAPVTAVDREKRAPRKAGAPRSPIKNGRTKPISPMPSIKARKKRAKTNPKRTEKPALGPEISSKIDLFGRRLPVFSENCLLQAQKEAESRLLHRGRLQAGVRRDCVLTMNPHSRSRPDGRSCSAPVLGLLDWVTLEFIFAYVQDGPAASEKRGQTSGAQVTL